MTFKLAPNAMSTLEILKAWLSIAEDDDSYDVFLTLLINYVSGWIERVTGRSFRLRRRTEDAAGSGRQELLLQEYPIRVIHSIRDKESGSAFAPEEYSLSGNHADIGVVYKDNGWLRRAYPTGLVPDFVLTRRYLVVDYTAGYVLPKDAGDDTPEEWLLPHDLQGILWQVAAQELALADSGADGLASFSISDVSWSFDKNPRQSWLDILAGYTRVV